MDDTDPFDQQHEQGVLIDLRDPPDVLHRRLADTLRREGEIYASGLACRIKEDPHACCSACPVRHADPADRMSALCELGMEQERLVTRLVAGRQHAA